ncbi:hypothetical protein ZWY2020_046825 [Hordeum vulgare]|nr:hypothetical protein ZWY2020_046825 [Hordeum vulgare]
MAATKASRSARRGSASVSASGVGEAGVAVKRSARAKSRSCTREAAAARTRRPRERRERTVGDEGSEGAGSARTKKEEWPRRRRSMERSAAEAEGGRRAVQATAGGERPPGQDHGWEREGEAEGLPGLEAW